MKLKKAMVCLAMGAVMMGSMGVSAATNTSELEDSTSISTSTNYSTNVDVVTNIHTINHLFEVGSETGQFSGVYVKGGKWRQDNKGWWYRFSDGTYPKNCSIIIDADNKYAITSLTSDTTDIDTMEETITVVNYKKQYQTKGWVKSASGSTTIIETVGEKFEQKIYTFDEDGYLITSQYKDGHWIDKNGVMDIRTGMKGAWKQNKKGWWYQLSDGSYLKDGYFVIYPNKWAVSGMGTNAGKVFYFDKNGYCVTSGFVKSDAGYGTSSGTVSAGTSTGTSTNYGDCYVWADKNGYVNVRIPYRWQKDSKGWWFGTIKGFGGNWYAKSQWLNLDGKWYYFDAKGYMVTGTQTINGKTYTFNKNGVWVK